MIIVAPAHSYKTRYLVNLANDENNKKNVVFITCEERAESLYQMGLNPSVKVDGLVKLNSIDNVDDLIHLFKDIYPESVLIFDNIGMFLSSRVDINDLQKYKDIHFSVQSVIPSL
jgi:hypothetical protein